MEFIKKYLVYVLGLLFVIALVWGAFNHFSVQSLQKKNASLITSNLKLTNDFNVKKTEWENRFYNLEVKAKQLEGKIKALNNDYSTLIKKNKELVTKLASIEIPVKKPEKIEKFKELGYDAEIITPSAPPSHEGALFDWVSSDKLLKVVMEVAVIKEMNVTLKESVDILEKKVLVQDEIIKNTEEEVRIALDMVEYTQKIVVEKDKTIEELGKVNEKLAKKAKRVTIWGGIGIVIGVIASVFIMGL